MVELENMYQNLKKLGFKVLVYEKYLNEKKIKNTKLSFVSLKKLLNFQILFL